MKRISNALKGLVSAATLLLNSPVYAEVQLMSTNASPAVQGTDIAARFAPTTQSPAALDSTLADRHGLTAEKKGTNIQYLAYVGDRKIVIGTYPPLASESEMAERNKSIHGKCEEKISALERKFSITVSDNRTIKYAANHGAQSQQERAMDVRQPNLGEALALEYALERSLPTSAPKTEVQFLFAVKSSLNGALAEWELSSRNKPTVVVDPSASERPLEYVLMHELSHHSQYRMGLDPLLAFEWKMTNTLGWRTFTNPLTGQTDWAITTTSGMLYKYCHHIRKWVSCNKDGQPVDCIGNRVAHHADADQMTSPEIAAIAKVRPCTNYMNNPLEVMAEGLTMYRMGTRQRSVLLKKSPELYQIVKHFDNKLIAKQYGAGMTRSADGLVVAINDKSVSTGQEFETREVASAGP